MAFKIEKASPEDIPQLAQIFLGHISAHHEYISHGEIQMGVGAGHFVDGELHSEPSDRAEKMWVKYIAEHINGEDWASVQMLVLEDGRIAGFCVTEITEDGAEPFGMLCDLLVKEEFRGLGYGKALLATALEWFHAHDIHDIYLESGKNNHSAHEFFIRSGFAKISEIFKLQ